jgi:hypothetical protein
MAQEGKAAMMQFGLRRDGQPVPGQFPFDGLQQSRHQAQQARFPAAVRPAQQQQLAGPQRKIDAREDHPLAALASEIAAGEGRRRWILSRLIHRARS